MKLEKLVNYGSREAVAQNLKDAGYTQEMAEYFMTRLDGEDTDGLLALLEEHRSCLLNKVHEGEKQIGCLDYLVYQIKRQDEGEREC